MHWHLMRTIDVSANILLVIAGLVIALFVGWSLGIKKFMKVANLGAVGLRVRPFWGVLIKYVIPVLILALFVGEIIRG